LRRAPDDPCVDVGDEGKKLRFGEAAALFDEKTRRIA
jgi:hypothetical protein